MKRKGEGKKEKRQKKPPKLPVALYCTSFKPTTDFFFFFSLKFWSGRSNRNIGEQAYKRKPERIKSWAIKNMAKKEGRKYGQKNRGQWEE